MLIWKTGVKRGKLIKHDNGYCLAMIPLDLREEFEVYMCSHGFFYEDGKFYIYSHNCNWEFVLQYLDSFSTWEQIYYNFQNNLQNVEQKNE